MLLIAIAFIALSRIALALGTLALFPSFANKKSRAMVATTPASGIVADTTDRVMRRYVQHVANWETEVAAQGSTTCRHSESMKGKNRYMPVCQQLFLGISGRMQSRYATNYIANTWGATA